MSYILNLFRYVIDVDVQLRIYPAGGKEMLVCCKNLKTSNKYIDGLKLVDVVTGENPAIHETEGWQAYTCNCDRSFHVIYKDRYVMTLESTPVWKTKSIKDANM